MPQALEFTSEIISTREILNLSKRNSFHGTVAIGPAGAFKNDNLILNAINVIFSVKKSELVSEIYFCHNKHKTKRCTLGNGESS